MLQVWTFSVLAFFILPFQVVNRTLSVWGFVILAAFILTFCLGAVLNSLHNRLRGAVVAASRHIALPDFTLADRVLMVVASLTILLLLYEFAQGNFLNLEDAWQERSDRAYDLMTGRASESSFVFQVAFLLYPASYVYLARAIVFERAPSLIRLSLFGALPVLMASLVMGGRGPLLYAFAVVLVSARVRSRLFPKDPAASERARHAGRGIVLAVIFGIAALAALNYFVQVFIVRAESAGGVEAMFDIAESAWGVSFQGPGSDLLFTVIGYGNAYLIFVFAWYLVQGIVMSNVLFTDYVGPPHFGVYGIDIFTAVMRRVNGDFVADRFFALLELNTYGFLPSAFGSLYVDFGYVGFGFAFLWGYLAAMVYNRCQRREDARWFLVAPFVLLGIFFSLINTPLGFGNGMVTHLWMIATFLLARKPFQAALPQPHIVQPAHSA